MVPLLVIGALYGAADSGQFAFTFRVMLAPVALVSLAYSQVFIGRITASRSSLGPVARSTARRLTIIGALPVAALGLLGPWLFPLLFGSTWSVAGWMALLLTPMLMAQVVVSPVSQVVNVCERQDLMLVWDVARLIVMIVVPVAAAALSSSALVGVAAMSFTGLLCYGVLWLLVLRVAGAKP
jgi:O-antigen/teichoic acid export membrane protein